MNYDQLLRMDDELESKYMDRLFANPATCSTVERHLQEAQRSRSPHAFNAQMLWELCFRKSSNTSAVPLTRLGCGVGWPNISCDLLTPSSRSVF